MLKEKRRQRAIPDDMTNNARPRKNCAYSGVIKTVTRTPVLSHPKSEHTTWTHQLGDQYSGNANGTYAMTCLREIPTYNACEQRWPCNICSRAGKPQDVQNMTQHIIRRKRKQTATHEETGQGKTEHIAQIQQLRLKALLLNPTQTPMPDNEETAPRKHPEPDMTDQSATHESATDMGLNELRKMEHRTTGMATNETTPGNKHSPENHNKSMGNGASRGLGTIGPILNRISIMQKERLHRDKSYIPPRNKGGTYTWPKCTCPIKPNHIVLTEMWGYMNGRLIPGRRSLIANATEKQDKKRNDKEKWNSRCNVPGWKYPD